MNQTEEVIQVQGLMKKYGSFMAVKGIDFKVNKGEVFGLLGPNGAGKTTTMEMIEGLRKPDGGTAKVSGYDTRTELNKVKEVIGVQLQSTSLFDLLKVRELIRCMPAFIPFPSRLSRCSKICFYLKMQTTGSRTYPADKSSVSL
jgi:ABC-2 type transport system ATP-binding protein